MKDIKKILICEDEEILLTALKFRLQKQGYELTLASDGEEAKALLQSDPPDLLVTDISLPNISGTELVTFLRESQQKDTPVILIAPMDDEEAIAEAMRLGANDFVTKPFKPVELVIRIRCIFEAQAALK
ncbi:response regulator transcription factor [Phaeodactylibacter luteus]|uniref:Response regulator n=1 Tax=Phaeodactylibacter luteus TaxID=1564516 RepID=A0A5C6RL83_9BACT|nr:response regulator transcription factor [Phaeodactylibacter luteus]TXB63161.1 response regulator [Phaeodactylibacter luteus]